MSFDPANVVRRYFSREDGTAGHLVARWLFLRALGLIYFSAFFSLVFQIKGLIGPQGILPASDYLPRVAQSLGPLRFWYAPTLLWFSSGSHMLTALCWVGILASLLVVLNVWPRAMLAACFLCFLSFVSAAQDFSSYQSDGMLLEAGFLSLFLVPRGLLPGWGAASLPSRASYLLLLWEWFRIYFESGVVKLRSGDPTWRNLTAMYEYYQNGPLPTWIGWYLQHLPHWFHIGTAALTLVMELGLVFLCFLPGRWRLGCFFLVTAWQAGVILTANYAFLNYLVLVLAFLLLDDRFLWDFVPARWRPEGLLRSDLRSGEVRWGPGAASTTTSNKAAVDRGADLGDGEPLEEDSGHEAAGRVGSGRKRVGSEGSGRERAGSEGAGNAGPDSDGAVPSRQRPSLAGSLRVALTAVGLSLLFYATLVPLVRMFWRRAPLPAEPVVALEPFRIANQYGLFAVMTPHRYEIEFQGSVDGRTWVAYPFRYKPQDPGRRPGIYAPYQPRFDWNLWFASLGTWTDYLFVPRTEELLLTNDRDVLGLFEANPFSSAPPRYVRAVLWQYWFSTPTEKRSSGAWWRRELLGTYAPTIVRTPDGTFAITEQPTLSGRDP